MTKDDAFELIDAYERDPNAPENRNNFRIVLDYSRVGIRVNTRQQKCVAW
jgi:hypothetical protein